MRKIAIVIDTKLSCDALMPELLMDNSRMLKQLGITQDIPIYVLPETGQSIGEQESLEWLPTGTCVLITMSPFVCRNATDIFTYKNGVLWEVKPIDAIRVVYGDILTSLSTGIFGNGVEEPKKATDMRRLKVELQVKSNQGIITESEKAELERLRRIIPLT